MALMVHESPKGDENHIHELYHSDGLRWQGSRKKDGKVSSKFSAGMGLARPNSVKPVQQSLGSKGSKKGTFREFDIIQRWA